MCPPGKGPLSIFISLDLESIPHWGSFLPSLCSPHCPSEGIGTGFGTFITMSVSGMSHSILDGSLPVARNVYFPAPFLPTMPAASALFWLMLTFS